jgi:hypothetical protein
MFPPSQRCKQWKHDSLALATGCVHSHTDVARQVLYMIDGGKFSGTLQTGVVKMVGRIDQARGCVVGVWRGERDGMRGGGAT